jgi:hypothetical protein
MTELSAMSPLTPPNHDLLTRARWCWNYLLVDGLSLLDAEKRLYQDNEFPAFVNLYAGTDWDALTDIAPLLVSISDEDPFAQRFLAEGFYPELGYLIRSSQGLHALANRLRQYLQVRHSTGADFILRLAHPGVAGMLFTEVKAFCSTLSGVQALLLPDIVRWQWQPMDVASGAGSEGAEENRTGFPLVLSDQEMGKLREVDEWTLLKKMTRHLDTYFPDWSPLSSRFRQSQLLGQLLARARNSGYTSERAQGQWTNVFGYSGHLERLEDLSPEILTLLDSPPKEADFASFERKASGAAILARQSALAGNHENSRTE